MARKTFQRRPQPANTAAGQRCHAAAAATVATAPVRPPRGGRRDGVHRPPNAGQRPRADGELPAQVRPAGLCRRLDRALRPPAPLLGVQPTQHESAPRNRGKHPQRGVARLARVQLLQRIDVRRPSGAATPAARALRGLPRAARALGPPALSVAKSWALPQRLLPRPLRHSGRQRAAAADDAEEARAVRRRVPLPSSAPA